MIHHYSLFSSQPEWSWCWWLGIEGDASEVYLISLVILFFQNGSSPNQSWSWLFEQMVIKFTSKQIPQWCIPVWKIAIGDWTQFCQLQEFTLNIERCICSIIYCQLRFYTVGFLSSGANYLKLLLAAERWIMDPATVRLDYENKLLIWIIWIRWLPERVSRIILNMVWDII